MRSAIARQWLKSLCLELRGGLPLFTEVSRGLLCFGGTVHPFYEKVVLGEERAVYEREKKRWTEFCTAYAICSAELLRSISDNFVLAASHSLKAHP